MQCGLLALLELINSADPNMESEPRAASQEPGRCRARKMKERSGPLIFTKESWHVCADFSTRWHNVIPGSNMWSGLSAIGVLRFSLGKVAGGPGSAKCLKTLRPQLHPVCPCLALCFKFWNSSVWRRKCSLSASVWPFCSDQLIFSFIRATWRPRKLMNLSKKKKSCFFLSEKVSTYQKFCSNLKQAK